MAKGRDIAPEEERGYGVVVVDNLSNSNEESLRRVKTITGKEVAFYNADIRNRAAMERIFSENTFDAVIHFAGLKAVGESVQKPIEYYDNNLYGTLVLLETMKAHNVKKLVFSSSATVYGTPEHLSLIEGCKEAGVYVYNLGTGVGYSVLDMIHAFEKACGKTLPYEIKPRRAGISPSAMQTPPRQRESSVGRQKTASRRCAATSGTGKAITRTATKQINEANQHGAPCGINRRAPFLKAAAAGQFAPPPRRYKSSLTLSLRFPPPSYPGADCGSIR